MYSLKSVSQLAEVIIQGKEPYKYFNTVHIVNMFATECHTYRALFPIPQTTDKITFLHIDSINNKINNKSINNLTIWFPSSMDEKLNLSMES